MDVICPSCGEPNPAGQEFCSQCNTYLSWDPAGERPAVPERPASPAGPDGHPSLAAPTSPRPGYGPAPSHHQDTVPLQVVDHSGPAEQQGADGSLATAQGEGCPNCGRVNDPSLRFCARCGFGFASSIPEAPSTQSASWRAQSAAAQDRAARRAYRRSLPPLYRWRRVLITLLVLTLLVGAAVVLGQDPVGIVKNGWYALNKDFVTVTPITAALEPGDATAAGSDPAALVDGSVQEWTMNWQPAGESDCGAAPGTATIVLSFAPTRIRRLQIVPGLDQSNSARALQPLPKGIGITYPGGPCRQVTLSNSDKQEPIVFDSRTEVTSVRIGIGSAYRNGADDAPLISLTEIKLKAYPR